MTIRKNTLVAALAAALVLFAAVSAWVIHTKANFYLTGPVSGISAVPYQPKVPFSAIKDGVWLHRVNSEERVRYFMNEYAGFEIDAYYDPQRDMFNVDHDNHDYGTSLDAMFTELRAKPGVYVWLDLKDLPDEHLEAAEQRLAWLLDKHAFPKDQFIVETGPANQLAYLGDRGYITSFTYWPGEDWTPQSTADWQKRFVESGASAMTVEILYYELAHAAFPDVPKLVWDMKSYNRKPYTYLGTLLRQRRIFDHPDVKVHLVGDKKLHR